MRRRYLINEIKQNKLENGAITFFLSISALVFGLTIFLFFSLIGSIDNLMEIAKSPDFLQMHSGELDENMVSDFATDQQNIELYQISRFLNLENGNISLNGNSLSDSTQDNGICIQNKYFDYLIDMENEVATVDKGEVYVPVCYRQLYDVSVGNTMSINGYKLVVTGFIRDSQMNSMMASSKRFLVNEEDYENIKEFGSEEYLIEFKLKKGADIGEFSQSYIEAGLPANGPTINYPLIRLMNALSDGIMIMVILIVSIVVLLISLLCIRFILLTSLEKSKKEIGLLKAIGISGKDIQNILIEKYVFLSMAGATLGYIGLVIISKPLGKGIEQLYGSCKNPVIVEIVTLVAVAIVEIIILLSVKRIVKKTEKMSAIQALYGEEKNKNSNTKQQILISAVIAACVFLMILPKNMSSTISSPKFVTYMGIGDGQIRLDIRQTDNLIEKTKMLSSILVQDERVLSFVSLQTKGVEIITSQGEERMINVEVGDHNIFPVKYAIGEAPDRDGEIALSFLNAKELGVGLGDRITIVGDELTEYTVCGIYSDITNGGKTAKAYSIPEKNHDVLWSIFYVSLVDGSDIDSWLTEYELKCVELSSQGAKVVGIQEYVDGTYGQTVLQIANASGLAKVVGVSIILVVVALFLRLLVEQQRNEMSLKKALGLQAKTILIEFLRTNIVFFAVGIVLGVFLGNVAGEAIVATVLKNLGAVGFSFVIDMFGVYMFIPALTGITLVIAAFLGCREISQIKAFECCTSQEV